MSYLAVFVLYDIVVQTLAAKQKTTTKQTTNACSLANLAFALSSTEQVSPQVLAVWLGRFPMSLELESLDAVDIRVLSRFFVFVVYQILLTSVFPRLPFFFLTCAYPPQSCNSQSFQLFELALVLPKGSHNTQHTTQHNTTQHTHTRTTSKTCCFFNCSHDAAGGGLAGLPQQGPPSKLQ